MKFITLRRPKSTLVLILGVLLLLHIGVVFINSYGVSFGPVNKDTHPDAENVKPRDTGPKSDINSIREQAFLLQNLGESSRKVAAKTAAELGSEASSKETEPRPQVVRPEQPQVPKPAPVIPPQQSFKDTGFAITGEIPKYVDFGRVEDFEDSCDAAYCIINGRRVKREIIKETPRDMFTAIPPEEQFEKEFRNPCWKAKTPAGIEKLFCIPYFYIIGFTKAGTTDMFHVLRNHTLVSARAGKETHYFDRHRRGRIPKMNRAPSLAPKSFMSYVNSGHFREELIQTYKMKEETDVLFHGITMDATPSHVWDNEFWEIFHPGYREPPVTNADVISTLYPKTKIIVSLRGPISRMQSAYQFFCAFHVYDCDRPVTPEKFHNLVVQAVDKFNKCLETNTLRGCVYSTETHQLATHLYASIYSVYLADWLAAFPREQIHIIKFEDHISHQIDSIQSICDFLEIPRFDDNQLAQYLEEHKVRNSLKEEKKIPYVMQETKDLLLAFFKPYLRDLVALLGDKKWDWNYYD